MPKILLYLSALLLTIIHLHAEDFTTISGNWHSISRSLNNGTETIEKEYLSLYPNSNFELVLLVSLKKGEAYVKDLRIEVSGIWEARYDVLVYVIKKINVPIAKEVYGINHKSLENFASSFRARYENDSIHISKIQSFKNNELQMTSEKGETSLYKR